MKNLLILVGLVFVIAGIATGMVSQVDYGKALIGLNLGLAATLLVGGFIILGLASIAGAIGNLSLTSAAASRETPRGATREPSTRTAPGSTALATDPKTDPVIASDVPDRKRSPLPKADAAVGTAAGAAAGMAIGAQFDKAGKSVDSAIDKVAEVAREAKEKAEQAAKKTAKTSGDKMEDVTGDLKETAVDTLENTKEDVKDAVAKVKEEVKSDAQTVAVKTADGDKNAADSKADAKKADANKTGDPVKAKTEESTDIPDSKEKDAKKDKGPGDASDSAGEEKSSDDHQDADDDGEQLFVVEELVIRGKQARVLSDDTVEAETAEGWMRFENVEHLEEYLDAMEG